MRRPFSAIPAVAFVLALNVVAVPGLVLAQTGATTGEPGPVADGVLVDAAHLPLRDAPTPVRALPRLYPVDLASFGQLKAGANAAAADAAAARTHLPGSASGTQTAPSGLFPTLDLGQGGAGTRRMEALLSPSNYIGGGERSLCTVRRTDR
jgi:hypothetical protein